VNATPFDFSGLQALVTGASGHLGTALSTALVSAGAHVWLAGRSEKNLEDLASRLEAEGGSATPITLDVTDAAAIEQASDRIRDRAGSLDILVSNAHAPRSQAYGDVRASSFAGAAGMAAGAAHELLRAFLPLMRRGPEEQPSSAILVASMYGSVSPDPRLYDDAASQNPADYGAAKAGLIQYARHAAVHLGAEGVRVNSLSPGPFPRTDVADPGFVERLAARVPLGRVGRPEELATAALFLAAPDSSFVTGVDLAVDGGWTAW
jgi:NAD(P)-dependent dehydrogenase (short-subunit alcohol dehydrogenase family)